MIQKIKTSLLSLAAVLAVSLPLLIAGTLTVGTGIAHAADPNASANVCTASGTNEECPSTGVCAGATNLTIGGQSTTNNASTPTTACTGVDETNTVDNLISTVLNIFSVVVGIIAVVMIIYAGFKYISSGGKEESVKTAKNTILYAIIGLVIVALAQVIVKFVLEKATTS